MKRFANEMIRILKNKRQRSLPIQEIPTEYGSIADAKKFADLTFHIVLL